MKRSTALKILNPILGVLLANQMLTGVLSDTLPREAFAILHKGGGVALAAAAVLHVILNWNWVKANFLAHAPTA